jgi:hypothetical protein
MDLHLRIFPGHYAPVIVMENGRRLVKPMRYQCRPGGKPAFYDAKLSETYNARRENLEGFWKELFGYSQRIAVVNAFFENVNEHRAEERELREGEDVCIGAGQGPVDARPTHQAETHCQRAN